MSPAWLLKCLYQSATSFCFTLLCLLVLCWPELSYANVTRLSTTEGLSQSRVTSMLVDRDGFLWIGTFGGVNRYDGDRIMRIADESGLLKDAAIYKLFEAPNGDVWITTLENGVFKFDISTGKVSHVPLESPDGQPPMVLSMLSLNEQQLLLGLYDSVARYNPATALLEPIWQLPDAQSHSGVRDLLIVQDHLFIATTEGLYVLSLTSGKSRRISYEQDPESITEQNTKVLTLGGHNQLFVGSVEGLYQIDLSSLSEFVEQESQELASQVLLQDINVWDIKKDLEGLTLATDKGLFSFYPKDNLLVKNNAIEDNGFELNDSSITQILMDDSGAMWVGAKDDGAFYLPSKLFTFENFTQATTKGDGLSHPVVFGMKEHQGLLWLATDNGLTALNPYTYQTQTFLKNYLADPLLSQFQILDVIPWQDSLLLFTMRGFYQFDTRDYTITPLTALNHENEALLEGVIFGGYLSDDGQLYALNEIHGPIMYDLNKRTVSKLAGDFAGLDSFYNASFFPPIEGFSSNPLFFHLGHLYEVDLVKARFRTIYDASPSNDNYAISYNGAVLDDLGQLWLSFSQVGLVKLDPSTLTPDVTATAQLNDAASLFYGLLKDELGMIWMSGHNGLWRLDPTTNYLQQYTTFDGLETNEFNQYSHTKLSDGRMAFGHIKGVTVFDPKHNVVTEPLIEQVNITSINLMSRSLKEENQYPITRIELEHDDVGLEVAFSAMSFFYQDRIRFEYQISGSARIALKNTNKVVFPSFQPGQYTLTVWAQDPFTGRYTPPTSLDIKVNYPLWRAPWMLVTYCIIALLLLTLWLSHRHRVERMIKAAHQEAVASEARLKLALEGSHSGVWDWQADTGQIYQPRLVSELGYQKETIALDGYLNLMHPEDKEKFRIEWLEFLSTDKGYFNCVYRLRHKTGQWRWYKDFGKVVEWSQQFPIRVAGTYTNMTRELVFEENARLFGAAFEQTSDWVFILDKKFRIRATNEAMRDAFGFSKDTVSSRRLSLGLNRDTRLNYLRIMSNLEAGQHYRAEDVVRTKDGKAHHVIIKVTAVENAENTLDSYIVVLTDISAQKAAEDELRELANYDALTRLPNRALLLDRISHATELAKRHQEKCALLFIDLNRFKQVNDSLGHDKGDLLLIQVACRLRDVLREQDTVARLGGDEFVILLEDVTEADEVLPVCHKIDESICAPMDLEGEVVTVSPSIGVAMFPDDAESAQDLLKSADIAMYHAKTSNGGVQFFKQEMNHKIQRKLKLETELMLASENNEFENFYQPIVNAITQQVEGFEVLLRWRHKNQIVPPGDFIDVAESTGLITKLTIQTLERALTAVKTWLVNSPDLYVSVNLSARDFDNARLARDIEQMLKFVDVAPEHLAFEITESVLMYDTEKALGVMREIKALGCRLYLDDFGTGYSSLTYLKRFPIDNIKIDRSFVKDIGVDRSDEAIIHSTLALAHALGKECVAEGVETQEQIDFLTAFGCESLQGFLYSKPIPKDEVPALIAKLNQGT